LASHRRLLPISGGFVLLFAFLVSACQRSSALVSADQPQKPASGGRGSRRAVLFNPRMPEERLGKLRRTQSSRTLARTSAKRLGSFRQRLRRGQQRSTLVNHGQPASSDAASDIPPSHAHRNKSKMTAPKPPARLGSFCEMPAVVNGGQRWSMAVNRRQRPKGPTRGSPD
jgi:hypothetical protein